MNLNNIINNKTIFRFISLLIVAWSVINLFNVNAIACEETKPPVKLSLKESQQLLEDVQYLLSSEETIDYDDPKLNEILNRRKDEYDLFKIYKAFIDFDKSKKTKKDIVRAADELDNLRSKNIYISLENIMANFFSLMSSQIIGYELKKVINDDLPHDIRSSIKIPLWLVLKYPDVLNYAYVRWSLDVNANYSINNLPSFNLFEKNLLEATGNYWDNYNGSRVIDYSYSSNNIKNIMSFAPSLFVEENTNYKEFDLIKSNNELNSNGKIFITFTLWSYEGIWNRLKYLKVLKLLDKATIELEKYYKNNYNLEQYAEYAKQILSSYVLDEIPGIPLSNFPINDEYYKDIINYYKIIAKLESFKNDIKLIKEFAQKLSRKEKGFILFYSILKNYEISFIQYLIDAGADVNVIMPCGETPLMASVTNPEMMKILLKSGADITIPNSFGKNVLFYAVQFGEIEVVKILLDNGAKTLINSKIYDNEQIDSVPDFAIDRLELHLTMVNNFTPLVYAKRYASTETIDLLIKHGAKEGSADPEKIKKWINHKTFDPQGY